MGFLGRLLGRSDAKGDSLYRIGPETGISGADPNEVRLADGSPLSYDLLVQERPDGVLMPAEVKRAKRLMNAILVSDRPDVIAAVNSCRGTTRERARAILLHISGTENVATEGEAA